MCGFSIELKLEPTGLEDDETRKMRHLHWDMSSDDLRKRLTELVEGSEIDEQVVVEECCAVVDFNLYSYVDADSKAESAAFRKNQLDKFKRRLSLPQSERILQAPDDELRGLIEYIESAEEKRGETDRSVQEALDFFRQERDRLLGFKFWRDFESARLRRKGLKTVGVRCEKNLSSAPTMP